MCNFNPIWYILVYFVLGTVMLFYYFGIVWIGHFRVHEPTPIAIRLPHKSIRANPTPRMDEGILFIFALSFYITHSHSLFQQQNKVTTITQVVNEDMYITGIIHVNYIWQSMCSVPLNLSHKHSWYLLVFVNSRNFCGLFHFSPVLFHS